MTVIEMRTMETICRNLPEIANQLKRIADMHEAKKCCICGKPLNGRGNNPWPYIKDENARCCDECNKKVLDARFELARKETK